MKTLLILRGMAGLLCVAALSAGAQETKDTVSSAPGSDPLPAVKSTVLREKLIAASASVSPSVIEVVKMSDAGADAAVLQAYVDNSPVAYSLRAEEIIYLHDHGISSSVVTTMIQHGAKVREQMAVAQASAAQAPASPLPPAITPSPSAYPVEQAVPAYTSSPTVVYPSAPVYYPSYAYSYPSYYYAPFPRVGFSFSLPLFYGHFGGGFHGHAYGGHSYGHSGGFHH